MKESKSIRYAITALCLLSATCHSLHAQIEHGTLSVNGDTNPPIVTLSQSASRTVTILAVNPADYWLGFSQDQASRHGVMISSVANNGRNGSYPTSSVHIDPRVDAGYYFEYILPIHRADPDGGDEMDIDAAFAYFPYDEFLGGHVENAVNGGPFTNIIGSDITGIKLGNQFSENASGTADDPDGAYTLNLLSLDPTATPDNGILLVSGGKNEDNYALSKANGATWTLFTHDNYVDGAVYERDPIAFVYLPTNKEHVQIPALGRINDNGTPIVSRGDFTVTFNGVNQPWHLKIPGHSPETGSLIISPEGGDGNNVDNILSYEWDPAARHWVIESRDLTGLTIQTLGGKPAFNFAFITKPPVYVDADATGANDGSSWENAYTSLWTAAYNAKAGYQIWVAAGTYLSSGTNDNDDSIQLGNSVRLYGGFKGNETLLSQRDPYANETIITGERGDPSDDSDNAFHVVTAFAQTGGYNVLDGFTITGGRARGSSNLEARGGGLLIETTDSIEVANCRFLDNSARDHGGAVWVRTDAKNLTFSNCSFKGNQAAQGGAIYVSEENRITFANCVFQGNLASDLGGALVARIPDAQVDLINCSFQGNRSGTVGSAIYSETAVNLSNTVVWGNQDGDLAPEDSLHQLYRSEGASTTTKYSLVQNLSQAGFGSLIDTDPRFLAPIDPTQAPSTEGNLALRNSSPLIDRGDNDANSSDKDVSGYSRFEGEAIDIGAHEASDAFQIAPNIAARGNVPTTIHHWFPEFSIEQYQNAFTQQETHGDFQLPGSHPSVDYESGTLDITFGNTTAALLNYTLTLTPYDGSHAPVHLDFTIKVGTHTLYVDPTAKGDRSGSSWENALPNLARALEYSESGDTIYVAAGSYRPDDGARYKYNTRAATFQLQSGVALYGGFPSGGGELAYRDYEANESVLNGSDIFLHVVTGSGTDATAILDGFTISDGYHNDLNATELNGVGLLNDAGSPTIRNCYFRQNTSTTTGRGAAIANQNGSNPLIEDCIFYGNRGNGGGGAIANLENSNPVIKNCRFIENFAGSIGGAVLNVNSSPQLLDCLFEENDAQSGGAIYNQDSSPTISGSDFVKNEGDLFGGAAYSTSSNATFQNCLFVSNNAGVRGGSMFMQGSSSTTLLGCQFLGNATYFNGGAIYSWEASTIEISGTRFESNFVEKGTGGAIFLSAGSASIEDTTFSNNSSLAGGAIYSFFNQLDIERATFVRNRSFGRAGAILVDQATANITASKFHGNRSNFSGGAIESVKSTLTAANSVFVHNRSQSDPGGAFQLDGESSLSVLNSALVANRADSGGGIWSASPVLLTNSILWENDTVSNELSQVEGPGGIAPESANNIIQGFPGGFDPLFVLPPGPIETAPPEDTSKIHYGNLRLQSDSPAIDAGVNTDSPAALDLGGNARIQNSTIDIGPYEGHRADYYYLFGHFDPHGDYNQNGYTNWEDYAHGADPFASHDPSQYARILNDDGQLKFAVSHRPNREDVNVRWEHSATLEPDSWVPLEVGVHFGLSSILFGEESRDYEFFLLETPSQTNFYRQVIDPDQ